MVVGYIIADMGEWRRDQRSVELLVAAIKENRKLTQICTEWEDFSLRGILFRKSDV